MHIVSSAKLHSTVFIGKTNLQMDLDPAKRPGMRLLADDQSQMLFVDYKGEIGRVPYTDVVSMIPKEQATFRKIFDAEYNKLLALPNASSAPTSELAYQVQFIQPAAEAPPKKRGRPSAQISTPMSHVQAGPGAGKTHD